jgi:hypothetical protein
MTDKNPHAKALGKLGGKKRWEGKTDEEKKAQLKKEPSMHAFLH